MDVLGNPRLCIFVDRTGIVQYSICTVEVKFGSVLCVIHDLGREMVIYRFYVPLWHVFMASQQAYEVIRLGVAVEPGTGCAEANATGTQVHKDEGRRLR